MDESLNPTASADLAALDADQATFEAVMADLAAHPGVPQVLRDAVPAMLRIASQRDQTLRDLVATVHGLANKVAQLVEISGG